jgi:hypothetical protein
MAAFDVPSPGQWTGDEERALHSSPRLLDESGLIPKAGLAILPKSGHGINLEEPASLPPARWAIPFRPGRSGPLGERRDSAARR